MITKEWATNPSLPHQPVSIISAISGLPRCASGGTASSLYYPVFTFQENARSYPSLINGICVFWWVVGWFWVQFFFFFFVLVFDYGDGVQCKDLYCESSFLTNLYFLSPIFTFWHCTTWIFCTHTIDTSCGGSVIWTCDFAVLVKQKVEDSISLLKQTREKDPVCLEKNPLIPYS
jgi:hypothetical protein